ncbi:MarR family winged helix-turn-helix transcriptional regulator [Dactylosporangium darangshiense]|uniref:HTH marR-type domain-containing protein n=1 Tax=Dactylosporangium darangshiense TaxID=579108 RepID=A0ABP8DCG3_9ACTN
MTTTSRSHPDTVVGALPGEPAVPLTVRLWHITKTARRHLERSVLGPAGLSLPDYAVLLLVSAGPEARTLDVGRRAGMAKATLNGIVTRLETRGLLSRRPAEDRRVVKLGITKDGRALLNRLRREAAVAETALLTGSTMSDDVRRLVAAMNLGADDVAAGHRDTSGPPGAVLLDGQHRDGPL